MLRDYEAFSEFEGCYVFEFFELEIATALMEEQVSAVVLLNTPLSAISLINVLPDGIYSAAQAYLYACQHHHPTPSLGLDDIERLTISSLLKHQLSIQETADDLFIHRNTLNYRLDKMYQKTGFQFRQFEDAMTYYALQHFCAK
jgi:DNA-binding NtrC family response regulator